MIHEDIQFHLELVMDCLSFPTSLTFDNEGIDYVTEAGLLFSNAPPRNDICSNSNSSISGRVLKVIKIDSDIGNNNHHYRLEILAEGFRSPLNGLTFHDNALYVSEGGYPGRIS